MIEIYISDKKLDLKPADTIALTKQINDIAEIQKRQADYTNQFTIPKTPNNVQIFEYLNIAGNQSTKPYKYSDVRLLSNGIPIASRGIAIISETKNQKEYQLHIYAGNYDLFSKIADKYITDLDWADLVHVFNDTTWSLSKANTSGYIYPIADTLNGKLVDKAAATVGYSDAVSLEYQVPHVFIHTIWQRIFDEAGLEYYGNFLTGTEFLNELVVADSNIVDADSYSVSATPNALGFNTNDDRLVADFYVSKTGYWLLESSVKLSMNKNSDIWFRIKKNGTLIFQNKVADENTSAQDYELNLSEEFLFNYNDHIEIFIGFVFCSACGWPNQSDGTLVSYTSSAIITSRFPFNDTIDFSEYLPKIKQIDFLRAIMQQWGLLYRLDNSGKYHFTTIEELLTGVEGTTDLSDKLQSETSETYRIGNYGLRNIFKYNYYDKDKLGAGYADSEIVTDIDNVEKEATIMDSIIEACGDYLSFREFNKLASVHSYENTESDDTKPEIFKLTGGDKLKTLMLKRITLTSNLSAVYINNMGTYTNVSTSAGVVMPFVQFSNLYWNILINDRYKAFSRMIQKPLKKKVFIWFTPVDVYHLNMFNIIYLRQYQSFFYLNKINNFIAGKPSDCELIKIN